MMIEPIKNPVALSGISSMATRDVLAALIETYQRQSEESVSLLSVGGVDAARRVAAGEVFDFVVLASGAIDKLSAAGQVDRATRTDLARSGVAIGVPAGAVHPDISSEAAVRDAVLRARSIGYSTGPSGMHVVTLFDRWDIAEEVAPRIVQAPPGVPVGTLVASGAIELCFQQLSELKDLAGVDVVGPLPPEIQLLTVFSGAVCMRSGNRARAHALLRYLASSEGDDVKRGHGMEPVRT